MSCIGDDPSSSFIISFRVPWGAAFFAFFAFSTYSWRFNVHSDTTSQFFSFFFLEVVEPFLWHPILLALLLSSSLLISCLLRLLHVSSLMISDKTVVFLSQLITTVTFHTLFVLLLIFPFSTSLFLDFSNRWLRFCIVTAL